MTCNSLISKYLNSNFGKYSGRLLNLLFLEKFLAIIHFWNQQRMEQIDSICVNILKDYQDILIFLGKST